MNIKQAKEQIKYAISAYLAKDGDGSYLIPIEKQRPIFLMGPPGIGKTAVMEQISGELGIGLVAYSMTHHTRQSALGLPFITQKSYGGKEYSVSKYTMSEIISSVYDRIEDEGVKEGILFLDEINCVSETLAPSMLQFLQYKIFGTHRVPDGWIVVTAGNPPEYNNSVREFDIVTWDRLKRIDVEPDFEVWKEYALTKGVHPAISTFLEIKKSDFYSVETTVYGKRFVTARGWVDLSDMIKVFEKKGFEVDEELIVQYLQNPFVAKDFAVYYKLFRKYRADYQIETILAGCASEKIINRAKNAEFDERVSLLGLIFDYICNDTRDVEAIEEMLRVLMKRIKLIKTDLLEKSAQNAALLLRKSADVLRANAQTGKSSGAMSAEAVKANKDAAKVLDEMAMLVESKPSAKGQDTFTAIKTVFESKKNHLQQSATEIKAHMNNALDFCESVFGMGFEIVLLVTEMTTVRSCARFIGRYGCENYFKFNKELLIKERQIEILKEIDDIDLDGEY